ncbi:hypothetical protein [Aureimonas jatrophae]|jgi:hypothetical protein|uniref:Uncharacterized protein n=1 Tax=Aureimonas jatrophae TaxID=1166073 RepID=A0A1H0KLS4_9HYPH|nr:hypothetical protein [Aureimonas jatrophae]MBB3948766.1 cytoskeletal protein RodZ [Aureimonas jatrophae]SDO56722.1 hypothetical protein SAMN05192530_10836 [Aureimonas jatrophae]
MKRTMLALAVATLVSGAALAQDTSTTNTNPVPGSEAGETSVIPPTAPSGAMAPAATAQPEQTSNPVPGTDQGKESAMPAAAASTVVTTGNAPATGSPTQQTSNPVPGTSTGDGNITPPSK